MKLIKQIGFKLIVSMCIVITFCAFVASTPVEASKVKTDDFYYSGTTKGTYVVEKGFLEKLVEAFDAILDYILGLITMGFRIVLVGWTALLERCLTWILEGATGEDIEIDKVSSTNITGSDDYITLDAIFFNRVPLLDINIFDFKIRDDVSPTGMELEKDKDKTAGETTTHNAPLTIVTENFVTNGEKTEFKAEPESTSDENVESNEKDSLVVILKKAIAGWYYTFRLISIMIMLVLLVFIGVKIALESSASQKALYKRVLVDWLIGMILVFFIHYIIIFIIQFNEIFVEQIVKLRESSPALKAYEYGLLERANLAEKKLDNVELEMTLYEEVKTRAYDAKLTVGTTGMIMYMVLVYYAWKFTFIYLKRYLTVAVLVIIAPLVAVSYAFNKVTTGKTEIFSNWLKELFFIVIVQSIHALMYVVFLDTALALSLSSVAGIILVFMLLNFMCQAEGIFRKIFNIKGNLLKDAESGGLKESINNLKNGLVGIGMGTKLAKGMTKSFVKTTMKPLTMAAGYGFGKVMEKRANSDKFKKSGQLKLKKTTERLGKIRRGSIALALQNEELDVEKLTEAVNSLKEGDIVEGKVVDQKYIEDEKASLEEIKKVANASEKQKEQYIKDFQTMTTKRARAKQYISGKWKEIMDPSHYVEKDENGVYKAVKTKRKYGVLGKKTDSMGMRLKTTVNIDNLLGLDKNSKEALKGQVDLIKSELLGFTGILIGLPTLVANPKVGAAFLYQGVHNSNKVHGYVGRNKHKIIKKLKLMPDGTYTLQRFEGHSKQEIANEAKRQAREQAGEVFEERAENDQKLKERLKRKYPKLYKALKTGGKAVGVTGAAVALTAIHPVTLPIAGMIIPVRNGVNSATSSFHNTKRVSNRADAKLYEKQVKCNDATLNYMADKYFEMEEDQQKEATNRHGSEFAAMYLAIKESTYQEIDEMSDEELKRDLGYEDITLVTNSDGKKQLSVSAENNIIDNAIIDSAQKSGIMDLENFDMSSTHLDQVTREIDTKLRTLGLINKEKTMSAVIPDIERKIKDRQAILSKEGTKPVEERMADQAIIEVMQENKDSKTANPSLVDNYAVMTKLTKKYEAFPGVVVSPETKLVQENMLAQKNDKSKDGSTKVENSMVLNTEKIQKTIQARKAILSTKSKKTINPETSNQMKEALKRKKITELDLQVLNKQEELDNGLINSLNEQLQNENGGLDSSIDGSLQLGQSSDKVLEMLNLQTKMHKDKLKLETISGKTKDVKLREYKNELFTSDGTINEDVWNVYNSSKRLKSDGSKKVVDRSSTAKNKNLNNINFAKSSIEDVLITLNNN